MEVFNFCHASLNPTVTCSTISSEGYEIANLISKELIMKQKGFMAYHSIKPPVDVTVELMCSVDLSHIIIWPQVSCQKSTGFEILASGNSECKRRSRSTEGTNFGNEFIKIGFGYLNNESGIVFHSTNVGTDTYPLNFLRRSLFNKQNAVRNVVILRIRIVKTYQSSVPAIGKLEVWGKPSRLCSKEVRTRVMHLWSFGNKSGQTLHNRYDPAKNSEEEVYTHSSVVSSSSTVVLHNDFEIPEDFIDPITCELMVLPVTLPSGKVVDQSTLEKHGLREAAWGRAPSDPFTGRLFTNTSKPIVAVALKARLDKFLVEHADRKEVQNIPRTVGRKQGCVSLSVNVSNLINLKGKSALKCGEQQYNKSSTSSNCIESKDTMRPYSNKVKRKDETVLKEGNKRAKLSASSLASNVFVETNRDSTVRYSERIHEEILDDSLDSALKSILSGLPTFVQFNCDEDVSLPISCCTECKGSETVYQLPCEHLLCRSCLVLKTKSKQLNCSACKVGFKSCDPIRYHV